MNLFLSSASFGLSIDQRMAKKAETGRGVALIIVLATIAIMSVSVLEFVYNTRINLHLAQNHRDEVKAYFLARSGINLQILSLRYQYELQSGDDLVADMIQRSNFQLWEYLPMLLPTFSSGVLASPVGTLDLTETGASGFGGLHGDIQFIDPSPEDGRINVNAFAGSNVDEAQLMRLCSLVQLPPTEMQNITATQDLLERYEVIAAIIDYIDPDSDLTVIEQGCRAVVGGAGNEISIYSDVEWEPKNEALISLGELRLVPGVTDGFMERFQEQITVYPVPGKFFPALADATGFAGFFCSHLQSPQTEETLCNLPDYGQAVWYLSMVMEGYVKFFENKLNVIGFYLGMTAGTNGPQERMAEGMRAGQMIAFMRNRDFRNVVRMFLSSPETALFFGAYSQNPELRQLFILNQMSETSLQLPDLTPLEAAFNWQAISALISVEVPSVFRLQAVGRYGSASRNITTVVDFREDPRLLYWREF